MAIRIFILILIFGQFSCSFSSGKTLKKEGQQLDELFSIMQGSYSSQEQAEADSSYFNISLHMYPIWQAKSGSRWLYVEQALFSKQDQPYRVRIYELKSVDANTIESKVYTLKNQERFIGHWKDASFFDEFDESILEEREGCAVYLDRQGKKRYGGSTKAEACKSTLRGASYASSKVVVEKNSVTSWDQGFDDQGNQVWGAEKGPYIFIKL